MAAEDRLRNERKNWRKDHPPHFVAKPRLNSDDTNNLFMWDVKIPAKPNSIWYPGLFAATMEFPAEYPLKPPKVRFQPIKGKPIFHPNVFPDGVVCMSIINPDDGRMHAYGKGGTWKPSITIKEVLLSLQAFLDESNALAAGREEAYKLRQSNFDEYKRRVKEQVAAVESVET